MKRRRAALLALVLAAGCDHGDAKPKLELNKETVRRLDAGPEIGPYKSASSPAPEPVSSPAPPPLPVDAGARVSPPTNQAPHAR